MNNRLDVSFSIKFFSRFNDCFNFFGFSCHWLFSNRIQVYDLIIRWNKFHLLFSIDNWTFFDRLIISLFWRSVIVLLYNLLINLSWFNYRFFFLCSGLTFLHTKYFLNNFLRGLQNVFLENLFSWHHDRHSSWNIFHIYHWSSNFLFSVNWSTYFSLFIDWSLNNLLFNDWLRNDFFGDDWLSQNLGRDLGFTNNLLSLCNRWFWIIYFGISNISISGHKTLTWTALKCVHSTYSSSWNLSRLVKLICLLSLINSGVLQVIL